MIKSSLRDYSDAYILAKGNITINKTWAAAAPNNRKKVVIFKNCAPLTDCISEINNTQVDSPRDTNIVMPLHNLIQYNDNYLKASGSLWQYCKDIPAVDNYGNIVEFNDANATDSFNFKAKMAGQTDNDGKINDVEIMVRLKYLSNFRRTLETPVINCEVTLLWVGLQIVL